MFILQSMGAVMKYEQPDVQTDLGNESEAKVLIIDDDRSIRRLACKALQNHCHVYDAADASSGLSYYKRYKPDIIFMDIQLPDASGHDLLSLIIRRDPEAFVVMFSGYNNEKNIVKAVQIGAKGFISKPFDTERMLRYLHQLPKLQ